MQQMGRGARQILVFDLDGVVREFRTDVADDVIETRLGLPRGTVADAAFRGAGLVKAVTGKITFEQWVASIVDHLVQLHPDRQAVETEFGRWTGYRGDLVPETVALLDELKAHGIPVFAFTNGTSLIPQEMRQHALDRRFDAVVNSADLGCKKPDADAYAAAHRIIEARLECLVDRADIIFVDDQRMNTEAAQAFGWQTIHFRTVGDVAAIRRLAGLPGRPPAEDVAPGHRVASAPTHRGGGAR